MKTQINPIETWGFETNFLASPGTVLAKRSPFLENINDVAKMTYLVSPNILNT